MLAAALRCGVTPAHFWRLSLSEWRALAAPASDDVLTRATFTALARKFPDDLT